MHSLSLPTWIIHISSVLEWITAMSLIFTYSERFDRPYWRNLSWGMLPALVSAMCACVWHFFDNAPSLEWLVLLQGATTLLGNTTMAIAAWWIYKQSQEAAV
jgi:Protein of unknown function (DUF2499)